jgi:glucose-fructose oxidoreductase
MRNTDDLSLPAASVSRRRFIVDTAASGLAGVLATGLAPALRAASSYDRTRLGVALVGLGGFATDTVAPEIASTRSVRLAGVVTGDPAGKGREWARRYGFSERSIYRYDEMDRMRDDDSIDFVHVTTPTGLHARDTCAAAAAGKHVLCEKPMSISVSEARRMIDACRTAGVLLGVDYRLEWEPHHRHLVELVRGGGQGELRAMNAEFSWHRRHEKPWLMDRALAGGGSFFDTGVYLVRAGEALVGAPPLRVAAVAGSSRTDHPVGIEETMSVMFEYAKGVTLSARTSYAYHAHGLEVATERGLTSCDGYGGGSTFGQSWRGNPSGKIVRPASGAPFKTTDTLQIAAVYDAFADALARGGGFPVDGVAGLRDLAVIEAVYAAAASACVLPVRLPDEFARVSGS